MQRDHTENTDPHGIYFPGKPVQLHEIRVIRLPRVNLYGLGVDVGRPLGHGVFVT